MIASTSLLRLLRGLLVVLCLWQAPRAFAVPVSDSGEKAAEVMEKAYALIDTASVLGWVQHSEMYMRHRLYTKRRGPWVRYVPDLLPLERGVNSYLSEAQVKVQSQGPVKKDYKLTAFTSSAKEMTGSRMVQFAGFHFCLAAPQLLEEQILNPLHRRNRPYYRYRLVYYGQAYGRRTAHIRITPRFKNAQLVKGYVDLDVLSGEVRHFDFTFTYKLRKMQVKGRPGERYPYSLLPERVTVVSRFSMLGNKVDELCNLTVNNRFAAPDTVPRSPVPLTGLKAREERLDATAQCLLRIDTSKVVTSIAHFDSIRPTALTLHEKSIRDEGKGDSSAHRRHRLLGPRTEQFLLSSHRFNLREDGNTTLRLPPMFTPSMVAWSKNRGVSLQARVRLEARMPKAEGYFSLAPRVGYTFKQKQVYWQVPLSIDCLPSLNGNVALEAGGGQHVYSNKQANELRRILEEAEVYDSLVHIINRYNFHDYRDFYVKSHFSFSPLSGLRFRLGGVYHSRSLIEWSDVASLSGLHRRLSSVGPHLEVQFTPEQYYYREGRRRFPLYSRYPTLLFSYERGLPVHRAATGYERIETGAYFRLPLYAMRSLFFRLGGGLYTHRSPNCFLDYDYFRFNYMPENWVDEMSGDFHLLSSRWYNESNFYLHAMTSYESPMLLFARVPLISPTILRERIYLNLLKVRTLGFYAEAGYGISTHIFDLGFFTGMAHDATFDFGFKFAVRLFDD